MVFGFSCLHTSSQNDKVEHQLQTLNNISHSPNHASITPIILVTCYKYCYLLAQYYASQNSSLCHSSIVFISSPPRLWPFMYLGCLCYPNLLATTKHKLAPCSTPCIFIGYSPLHRGYKCSTIYPHVKSYFPSCHLWWICIPILLYSTIIF